MDQGPAVAAILTVVTGVLGVLLYLLCKWLCCKSQGTYTSVNHGLDDEETAFKKAMETNGDDIDELFNFSGQDELEFDTNDLDNLEMLEKYRSNLAASTEANMVETGLGKHDGRNTKQASDKAPMGETTEKDALLNGDEMEGEGPHGAENGTEIRGVGGRGKSEGS
ncbi:unnamed protein product [Discosporangium mesarthrocarpum]